MGREAVSEGQKGLGGSACVGRPYQMDGTDRKALPKGREGSGGPPGGLVMLGRPSWRAMRVGKPFQKAGRDREGLGKLAGPIVGV